MGEQRDAIFNAACQALALVIVATCVDPVVKTLNYGARTFVFLCLMLHIAYRIATTKRNAVPN